MCMRNWWTVLSAILVVVAVAPVVGGGQVVERPDDMQVYALADVDRLGDRIRILYQTMPALEQAARDDWTINVYIVEIGSDGKVAQRRLASSQQRYNSLVLRRGHDELLVVPNLTDGTGGRQPQRLESWSTGKGEVLWSGIVPLVPDLGSGLPSIFPTDDGNLFVVNHPPVSARDRGPTELTWHKLSPRGDVLGTGKYSHGGAVVILHGAFPAVAGGVGLTLGLVLGRDMETLETDIENPIVRTIGERTIEASVFSETRMLVTDGGGKQLWVSPALERAFMWGGQMQFTNAPGTEAMVRESTEQVALTEKIELEHAAGQTLDHMTTAQYDKIKSAPAGYGAMAMVTANRRVEPTAAGPYYLEIGRDGSLRRRVHLEPVAVRLGSMRFKDFLPGDDGSLLLFGRHELPGTRQSRTHATLVDASGAPVWTVALEEGNGHLEGIAGTVSNAWVFGNDWSDEFQRNLLWLEKVDATRAGPVPELPVSKKRPKPRAPAAADSAAAVVAPPDLPKPGEGCTCSCEEYAEIRKLMESVQKLSDAEKMKIGSDPGFLEKLMCAGQCGAQYAQCPTD